MDAERLIRLIRGLISLPSLILFIYLSSETFSRRLPAAERQILIISSSASISEFSWISISLFYSVATAVRPPQRSYPVVSFRDMTDINPRDRTPIYLLAIRHIFSFFILYRNSLGPSCI